MGYTVLSGRLKAQVLLRAGECGTGRAQERDQDAVGRWTLHSRHQYREDATGVAAAASAPTTAPALAAAPAAEPSLSPAPRRPTKADRQRLERLLSRMQREEAELTARYGSTVVPGSVRSVRIQDAQALSKVLDYLASQ